MRGRVPSTHAFIEPSQEERFRPAKGFRVIQIAENIQNKFLDFLREKLGMESFQMWIDGQFQIFCGEGTDVLYITAGLPFVLNWYRQFFLPTFQEAADLLIPDFRGKIQICSSEEARSSLALKQTPAPNVSEASEMPIFSAEPEVSRTSAGTLPARSGKKKTGARSAKRESRSQTLPQSTSALSTAERLKLRKQNSSEILRDVRQANLQEVLAFLTGDEAQAEAQADLRRKAETEENAGSQISKDPVKKKSLKSTQTQSIFNAAKTKKAKKTGETEKAGIASNTVRAEKTTASENAAQSRKAKQTAKAKTQAGSSRKTSAAKQTGKKSSASENALSISSMDEFLSCMDGLYADGTIPRFSGFEALSASEKTAFHENGPEDRSAFSEVSTDAEHSALSDTATPSALKYSDVQPTEKDSKTEISTETLTASVRTVRAGSSRLQTLMANVMKISTEEEDQPQDTLRQDHFQPKHSIERTVQPGSAFRQTSVSQPRKMDFSTFIMGASNRLAYTLARDITRTPGLLSPALISGKTGVGKSHLLEAISHATLRSGFHVVYRTAEEFVNDFVASLRDPGRKNDFRSTYRQCDVLLLDNLQFLLDKKGSLAELQNIFYHRIRQGKQIVFAADRPLEELEGLGQEICSNLRGGYHAVLNEPSYDVLLQLLDSESVRRALPLAEASRQALAAQHTGGDIRQVFGILNSLEMRLRSQLDFTQTASQTDLDRSGLVQELMEDLVNHQGKRVSLDTIKRYVAARFEIEVGLLSSGLRTRKISQPRMLAMWLARKFTRKPLSEIGQAFGCISHSTVISAQKKVNEWRLRDFQIQTGGAILNVNEVLRQLEGQLQRTV